ncbi:MAG: tryptophan-rich sensory protein [Oscillospiraceae bacterium]|nr:tryptophan-rich sensory protein [Oscillospiraceae bacterium]
MKGKTNKILTYLVAIAVPLAVGGLSAWINAGKFDDPSLVQPPLSPPGWVFFVVWTILYVLMGISAARVQLYGGAAAGDALFIWATQLVVNFLWTIFYFSFGALLLSFFWLLFLIALVALMAVRFERAVTGAGKLQIPYLVWLAFATYLNFATWLLNR